MKKELCTQCGDKIEKPFSKWNEVFCQPICADFYAEGIKIDQPYWLDIYDKLRQIHQEIKDTIYGETWENCNEKQKNAIEAVHSVLYLAEGVFSTDPEDK